ncbi:winged helix-turn-helix transcriptional regulator [Nocardiopsis sp. HNM0947]|uniref:Winged helix-turn-helix transcriptional regulator n=1 Tax=Nocardiopsis coralli TaxID=2772213 RepID=A0ABR9P8I6_9ACTN|nr:winged helix-turn-helix domain-containing protein [Nocardiopsis coralli]MBE3000156.1 winged helix-turn-helix transcriptional regulator [Nocardiopsis coralli]
MRWKELLPRWVQITDELERQIQSGRYSPGERVPSVLTVMEQYGVASATAHKALVGLRDRGLTETHPGLGSYVKREREERTEREEDGQ